MEDEKAKATTEEPTDRKSKAPVSQNILEGEEENFMTITPKEKANWIKTIKTRHAVLVKREHDHKKWQDEMTQRRIDVYNKSKKLLNSQRERFRFLFKMAEVVKNLSENRLKENENEENNDMNDNNNNNNSENNNNVNNTDDNKNGVERSTNNENENGQGDNSAPAILIHEPTQ